MKTELGENKTLIVWQHTAVTMALVTSPLNKGKAVAITDGIRVVLPVKVLFIFLGLRAKGWFIWREGEREKVRVREVWYFLSRILYVTSRLYAGDTYKWTADLRHVQLEFGQVHWMFCVSIKIHSCTQQNRRGAGRGFLYLWVGQHHTNLWETSGSDLTWG